MPRNRSSSMLEFSRAQIEWRKNVHDLEGNIGAAITCTVDVLYRATVRLYFVI
jgi:hypothetical protein